MIETILRSKPTIKETCIHPKLSQNINRNVIRLPLKDRQTERERERENETGKRSFLFLKAPGDQYLAESTFGPPKVAGLNSEAIRFAISSLVPSRFPPTVPGPEKE